MKKTIVAAILLLAVQVALVVMTHSTGTIDLSASPQTPLLPMKAEEVTELVITGETHEQVRLIREKDHWLLPDLGGAPADRAAVEGVLAKLEGLRQGFVVASSREAAKRFQVEEDAFLRHLVVRQKDTQVANLYLGTSPTYRQVHARKAGSDDIVAVNLAAYELWSTTDQWLDKHLVALDQQEISAIAFPDISLTRVEEKGEKEGEAVTVWHRADGSQVDQQAVEELFQALTTLSVTSADVKDRSLADPTLQFTVKTGNSNALTYTFTVAEQDRVTLVRSDRELLLTVVTNHTAQGSTLRHVAGKKRGANKKLSMHMKASKQSGSLRSKSNRKKAKSSSKKKRR